MPTRLRARRHRSGLWVAQAPPSAPAGVYAQDSFTDVAATNLTSHTAEVGGQWANNSVSSQQHAISDAGRARLAGNTGTGIAHLPASPPADAETVAKLRYLTNVGSVYGITGRYSTTTDTGYVLRRVVSSQQWQLARLNAGSLTSLGTAAVGVPLVADTNYEVILRYVGASITALVGGAVVIGPVTDATPILTAGKGGMRSSASGGTVGDTVGMHFDDFIVRDPTA
jgi:hypothetical protein